MADVHDLFLKYKFTDRGNSRVFEIRQELLSSPSDNIQHTKLGQLRISEDGTIHDVEWDRKKPERERTCEGAGTG
jgi:hypothetical protein